MRDYYFVGGGGRVAVSDLPTEKIHQLLADGIILVDDDFNDTEEAVMERLRLELFIRSNGI